MDLADLSQTINAALTTMDQELALAKKAMGIRPDLEEAKARIQAADLAISLIAVSVLRAQHLGVITPPDVIERVNRTHLQMLDLINEVDQCTRVIMTQDALYGARRPASN
jgi:hypothetical protein